MLGASIVNGGSSLLQNHPPDDILYLHCVRCTSSYGSEHAFKKHFRNSHGYTPTCDDVLIQGIKATKEYVMSKQDNQAVGANNSPPPRRHCNYCGWQCDQANSSLFTRHMKEHYDVTGCFYRCMYCSQEFSDPNTLRQHVVEHRVIYQHICAYCCLAYAAEEQLVSHMLTQHNMQYTSRKVGLPVSIVLPSPLTVAQTRHEINAPMNSSRMQVKGNPSQIYAEYMQPKMVHGKIAPFARPQLCAVMPTNPYSMQPAKPIMIASPRHVDMKSASSPGYKKSPPVYKSEPSAPVSDSIKGLAPRQTAQIDVKTLLYNAVELGFKNAGKVSHLKY